MRFTQQLKNILVVVGIACLAWGCKEVAQLGGVGVPAEEETSVTNKLIAGGGGEMRASKVTFSSLTLHWFPARWIGSIDERTEYRVYISKSEPITTVEEAEKNGEAISEWTKDIRSMEISELTAGTSYSINVLARIEAEDAVVSYKPKAFGTLTYDAPLPGLEGQLTVSSTTGTDVELAFGTATDDRTDSVSLEYRGYFSTSGNVDTLEAILANGTPGGEWLTRVSALEVTGLEEATDYFFNIVVRDGDGLMAAYNMVTGITKDLTFPVAPDSVVYSDVRVDGFKASWDAATDNRTEQANLRYRAFATINGATLLLSHAEDEAVEMTNGWTSDLTAVVSDLDDDTKYYAVVFVTDEGGNVTRYKNNPVTTNKEYAPSVSNKTITVTDITVTSAKVTWVTATDDDTPVTDIEYAIYVSTSNNVDTAANAVANGVVAMDWTANASTYVVTTLTEGVKNYLNVLARDRDEIASAYNSVTITTPDETGPEVIGSSLTVTNTTAFSIGVSWAAATDNATSQSALKYAVYISTSNNITTAADAFNNGTQAVGWTTGITNAVAGSLSGSTTYFLNVVVRDNESNVTAYTSTSATTN